VADAVAESPHAKIDSAGASRPSWCEGCHGDGRAHAEDGDPLKIANPARLSAKARNQMCSKCHAAEAGPFTHRHPVVEIEGCVACHSPHSSKNAHMLTVSDVNTLCQQCHSLAAAPAASDTPIHNAAAQFAPCTTCHAQIHGSNVSNVFFK
jgi:predicted CXXCH cytochrome family protein